MICSVWPAQPWFSVLLELACEVTVLFHTSQNLLVPATGDTHPLLQNGSLWLAGWMLSGEASDGKVFRNHWPTFSWPGIAPLHSCLTKRPGGTGSIGAFDERKFLIGPFKIGFGHEG